MLIVAITEMIRIVRLNVIMLSVVVPWNWGYNFEFIYSHIAVLISGHCLIIVATPKHSSINAIIYLCHLLIWV
jgi:hypothetical protein